MLERVLIVFVRMSDSGASDSSTSHAMEQKRKAAEILGISYRGLGKKMVRLGIEGTRRHR